MNTLFATIAALTSQGFRISFAANAGKIRIRISDRQNDDSVRHSDVFLPTDEAAEYSDEKVAEDLRRGAKLLKFEK